MRLHSCIRNRECLSGALHAQQCPASTQAFVWLALEESRFVTVQRFSRMPLCVSISLAFPIRRGGDSCSVVSCSGGGEVWFGADGVVDVGVAGCLRCGDW